MNTATVIASMKSTLDNLSANYATLPIETIRAQRSAAMDAGRAIMNDEAVSRDEFMAAYDLVIELDRVGY